MTKRVLVLLSLFLPILAVCTSGPERITLIIAGGAFGPDLDLTVAGTQRFMEKYPNIRVGVRPIPRTHTGRLALYEELFSEQSDEIDVLQIDVVWIGMLAPHAVDLSQYLSQEEVDLHFKSMVENNTINGSLVAVPWFSDSPSLFFRKDLLEEYGFQAPPETWDELESMARTIQDGERTKGNLGFWGYVWQGAAYEGLTCNALEWQHSFNGGSFIDSEGNPSLTNPETIQAFQKIASWIGSISPREVLNFDEEESRLIWERGDAAFLRNWSFVYSTAKAGTMVSDKFAVAPLPAGPAGSRGTLGGWQLMVSKYSQHREEAAALVSFLASEGEQRRRAIEGSHNPTIRSLYSDPDVLAAVPFFEGFEETVDKLVVRPSTETGAKYDQISSVYSQAVHDILDGADAEERLAEAEGQISDLLK